MYSIGERTMPDSVVHREKELCVEHIFCMHSMECVNNMWLQVESYIDYVYLLGFHCTGQPNPVKCVYFGQLHILHVLNVCLAWFWVASRFSFN